jgi:hypothetical protein
MNLEISFIKDLIKEKFSFSRFLFGKEIDRLKLSAPSSWFKKAGSYSDKELLEAHMFTVPIIRRVGSKLREVNFELID